MRLAPLLAASLVLLVPTAQAAENGLSLSGPATLTLDGKTSAPLRVALTLQNVVCTREAEIPVALSIAKQHGAQASLGWDRVVFKVASHGAATRWSADAQASVVIDPRAATGLVEVLARYDLPSHCVAGGGARGGEARHAIRFAEAGREQEVQQVTTVKTLPPRTAEPNEITPPVQGAILGMCLGGVIVLVKRLRARSA